jgi:beta-ribofuranosylaminobenzene 5'-phosphate synthase
MSERTIKIRTCSRLAFGLIDMNGEIGRVEGGLGLALEDPYLQLRARRAKKVTIGGRVPISDGTRAKLEALCTRVREQYPVVEGVDLEFDQVLPANSGLGSGTQRGMAVAFALSMLYDLKLSREQLAGFAERGGTSGIGCAAFDMGGFLCDGGHKFRVPGGKMGFAPSSGSTGFAPPPILFHSPLPANWRVILALPKGRIVAGEEEQALFREQCPVPAAEAAQAARLALLKVLPAVLEADIEAFGSGLEAMQRLGLKRIQIERQNQVIRDTLAEMRRLGLRGVGMSSWGPALFGFSDAGPEVDRATAAALDAFGAQRDGITVFVTKPSERGTTWNWE